MRGCVSGYMCVRETFCTLILARQIILALIFITHSDTFQNYAQTNWASDRQTSYKCKCCQLILSIWGLGVNGSTGLRDFGLGVRYPSPTTENEMNEYEKPQTDNKINAKCEAFCGVWSAASQGLTINIIGHHQDVSISWATKTFRIPNFGLPVYEFYKWCGARTGMGLYSAWLQISTLTKGRAALL